MGCGRTWPSVEPVAASAIAPGPCRGWGRNPSARIRAQKEPVFSPVGAGIEYRRPSRSPGASHREAPGDLPRRRKHAEQTARGGWTVDEAAFAPVGQDLPGRRAHVAEGWRAGCFAGAKRAHRRSTMRWGNYGDDRRGLRAALRLPPLARRPGFDSTGALPLQSG